MPRKSKEKNELTANLPNTTSKKQNSNAKKASITEESTTIIKKTNTSKKHETASGKKRVVKNNHKKINNLEKANNPEKNKSNITKKISKTSETSITARSNSTKKSSPTRKSQKKAIDVIEYYDLPYRYNQTIIKLLAQTPKSLFVYWDISDTDKNELILKYGNNFFDETKPVLIVHNETMNYSFEVEINDYANCWYLKVNDADCLYKIELGRRYLNPNNVQNSNYIYVTASNDLQAPNDHILFNSLNTVVLKNTQTNKTFSKSVSNIKTLKNIGKIYNIYDFYKNTYSEELLQSFDFNNPSSRISF